MSPAEWAASTPFSLCHCEVLYRERERERERKWILLKESEQQILMLPRSVSVLDYDLSDVPST